MSHMLICTGETIHDCIVCDNQFTNTVEPVLRGHCIKYQKKKKKWANSVNTLIVRKSDSLALQCRKAFNRCNGIQDWRSFDQPGFCT